MRVHCQDLPPETLARFKSIAQHGGLGEGALFLALRRGWMLWVGLPALGIGALSAWVLRTGGYSGDSRWDFLLPWAGLVGLAYGFVAVLEFLRCRTAELKPFLLVTPLNLIKCRGSQHPLEMYRLAEARALQRVEDYNGAKWRGQEFVFDFDGGHKVRFTLSSRSAIEAAERTLDLARRAAQGERLPDGPVRDAGELRPAHVQEWPGGSVRQQLLDPTSETWVFTLLVPVIGLMAWAMFR
jgi:hypothetical protein